MKKPVRLLSSKLAYLFARNANVNKSKDKRRSLTCDNSNGKRARLDCAGQDIQHLTSALSHRLLSPVAYHCVNDRMSWKVTCMDRTDRALDLFGSTEHYLPLRCRHLMLPRVHGPSTSRDGEMLVDSGDTRATASIKSIMFEQWQCHQNKGYPTGSHVCHKQSNQSKSVLQRVLPLLTTTSLLYTDHNFEIQDLIRSASRATILTKQIVALYFVSLVDLANQGIIEMSQMTNNNNRIHTASFPNIYCCLRKNNK